MDKIAKATEAYLRKCKSEGTVYQQPAEGCSTVKGDIINLKNTNGLIATYDCKKQRFVNNEIE